MLMIFWSIEDYNLNKINFTIALIKKELQHNRTNNSFQSTQIVLADLPSNCFAALLYSATTLLLWLAS